MTPDIPPAKIPVIVLYNIDPEWTKAEKDEVIRLSTELNDALQKTGYPTVAVAIENENIAASLRPFEPAGHIIFNWCEGLPGVKNSEWMVVKNLERLGYTFTGADSDTLLLAYDKQKIKIILDEAAVPTPAWHVFNTTDAGNWEIFPAIVKPQNEHCSAGITPESVVMNKRDLNKRIAYILETYQQSALVEDFIDGREFHVAVLGNEKLTVLPAAEMDFARFTNLSERLCTYDAKFIPGSQHYEEIQTLLPAPLTPDEKMNLGKVCRDAYRATGCRDYARMDIRLRDNVFYVLDVNPNADISSDASMACAAEEAGISYAGLGSMIAQMAARRHPIFGKRR